jgi:CO/xanthine dehydrogenase Mo-binding subunit
MGWLSTVPVARALGIACGTEKGSYVASAAEVSPLANGFTVERLVVAFECGAIVNPDGLSNQVEGSIVQGLGGALFEAIAFANGQLSNGSMGAGETPIVCVAPAIGSAVRSLGTVATELPVKLV